MAANPIQVPPGSDPWIFVQFQDVGACTDCVPFASSIALAGAPQPLETSFELIGYGAVDNRQVPVRISRSAVDLVHYYRPFNLVCRASGSRPAGRGQQFPPEEMSWEGLYYFEPNSGLLTSALLPRIEFAAPSDVGRPRDAVGFRFLRNDQTYDSLPIASLKMYPPDLGGVEWQIVVALKFDQALAQTMHCDLELRAHEYPVKAIAGDFRIVLGKAALEQNLRQAKGASIPLKLSLRRNGYDEPFGECAHSGGIVSATLEIGIQIRNVDGTWKDVAHARRPGATDLTLETGTAPLLVLEQENHPGRREYFHSEMPAEINFRVATMSNGSSAGQVWLRLLSGSAPCNVSINETTNRLSPERPKFELVLPKAGKERLLQVAVWTDDNPADPKLKLKLRLLPVRTTGKTSLIIDYGTCAIAAAVVEQGETATPLAPGDRLIKFDRNHDEATDADDAADSRPFAGKGMLIASHVGLGGPRTASYADPDRRPISAPWRPWAFPETMRGRPNGGDGADDAAERLDWLDRTYDVMLPFVRAEDKNKYSRILFGAKVLLRRRQQSATLPRRGNGYLPANPKETRVWHRGANGQQYTDDILLEPLFKDLLDEFLELYVEAPESKAAAARLRHLERGLKRGLDIATAVGGLELILTHPCGLTRTQRKRYKTAGAHVLLRWRYGPLIRLVRRLGTLPQQQANGWHGVLGLTSDIMQSVHLVAEPLAAACAVLRSNRAEIANFACPFDLLIVDIGAGTTDAVLLEIKEAGEVPKWSIKASHTCRLGGNALDCLIAQCALNFMKGTELGSYCDEAEWSRTTSYGGVTNPELARAILKAKRAYSASHQEAGGKFVLPVSRKREHGLFHQIPETALDRFNRGAKPDTREGQEPDVLWLAVPIDHLKRHLEPFLTGLAREIHAVIPAATVRHRRKLALTGRGSLFAPLKDAIMRELTEFAPIADVARQPTQMKLAVANGAAELLRVPLDLIDYGDTQIDSRLLLPSPRIWWAIGKDGEPDTVECGEIDLRKLTDAFARREGTAIDQTIRIFVVPCGYQRDEVLAAVRGFFAKNAADRAPDEGDDPDVVRQFARNDIARPAAAYSVNLFATGVCAAQRIVWTLKEADPDADRGKLQNNAKSIYSNPAIDLQWVTEVSGTSETPGGQFFRIEFDGPISLADGVTHP